jgi:hypothetical protein
VSAVLLVVQGLMPPVVLLLLLKAGTYLFGKLL